jgi:hypothetical protein
MKVEAINQPVMNRGATIAAPYPVATTDSVGAVSWAAVLSGAVAAAALSLILLVLGAGFGFTAMSPWRPSVDGGTTFGVSSILWVTLTALFASALGGYIAGRLRTRWDGTHVDEVYFRDTAHGFLAWAVATLVTAGLLTSAIGSIAGKTADAGASLAGAAGTVAVAAGPGTGRSAGESAGDSGSVGYFTDTLFRRDPSAASTTDASVNQAPEVARIFVQSLRTGALTPDDTHYVGGLVAQRTGLSQQDAEKRVTDVFGRAKAAADEAATNAKQAADNARKAGASASFWLFVSLLLGAFGASLAATFGGRQRDL